MEIHVYNIPEFSVTLPQLKRRIAEVLHGTDFDEYHTLPLNFDVQFRPVRGNAPRTAKLTVPTAEIGEHFLRECGSSWPRSAIVAGEGGERKVVKFERGRYDPRPELVHRLQKLPYIDPQAEEDQLRLAANLRQHVVHVSTVQFGITCRDGAFSVEYEIPCEGIARLGFDGDRRQFRLKIHEEDRNTIIAIRASQISGTAIGSDPSTQLPAIFFSLMYPPSYEAEDPTDVYYDDEFDLFDLALPRSDGSHRSRLLALYDDHEVYAAYASLSMRVICEGEPALYNFQWICQTAHILLRNSSHQVERRDIFSPVVVNEYRDWLRTWHYPVAFQLDAIARANTLDLQELLSLGPLLADTVKEKGKHWSASLLRYFHSEARDTSWYRKTQTTSQLDPIVELFTRCKNTFVTPVHQDTREKTFECYHAKVTPTRILLEGPFPERSNRVMRKYAPYTSHFLRVSFMDENLLQYRFDRDVDGHSFIEERIGTLLLDGLTIAGRHFDFLAYSQSGLKQHSV